MCGQSARRRSPDLAALSLIELRNYYSDTPGPPNDGGESTSALSTRLGGYLRKHRLMKSTRLILAIFVLSATAGCFAALPVQPLKVVGTAMAPALNDGDKIVVERNPAQLSRGDIVIFYFPEDPTQTSIKRIVGLPGETVEIRELQVLINGRVIEEPYVDPENNYNFENIASVKVPGDSYYVIGDNRHESSDSRIWGPLQRKFIFAKYIGRYQAAK